MKYEITKEQILDLHSTAKKGGKADTKMREWFPEAFKTVLEVGKWYKDLRSPFLYHPVDIKNANAIKAYGFDASGKYNELGDFDWGTPNNFKEATESEVFEALKKEAVKRGFGEKGIYFKCLVSGKICKSKGSVYIPEKGKRVIFLNGVWAEIIPTITKQEAEKQLGKKIID